MGKKKLRKTQPRLGGQGSELGACETSVLKKTLDDEEHPGSASQVHAAT